MFWEFKLAWWPEIQGTIIMHGGRKNRELLLCMVAGNTGNYYYAWWLERDGIALWSRNRALIWGFNLNVELE